MKRFLLYIVSVALSVISTEHVQATNIADTTRVYTKAMADSAYANADYATAIHIYEQLISM